MRWNEIMTEELSVVQMAKSYIMDILMPLKAQGVGSITVKQITDQLSNSPDFDGTNVEPDLINQAIRGIKGLKVEADPETNQMSVFIDNPAAGRQVDDKQAAKDEKNIHSAAMRTLDKKDSGGL
jgi:hypothetical protein